MIEQFIRNKQLYIPKHDFYILKLKYTKDEIIDEITKKILNHEIDFPSHKITLDDVYKDFRDLIELNDKLLFQFDKEQITRYDYQYPLGSYIIKQNNIGNKASNYFQYYNRMNCDAPRSSKAPLKIWNIERSVKSFLSAIFTLKFDSINSHTIMTAIALRRYIASQFKPSVAKAIYNISNAKKSIRF